MKENTFWSWVLLHCPIIFWWINHLLDDLIRYGNQKWRFRVLNFSVRLRGNNNEGVNFRWLKFLFSSKEVQKSPSKNQFLASQKKNAAPKLAHFKNYADAGWLNFSLPQEFELNSNGAKSGMIFFSRRATSVKIWFMDGPTKMLTMRISTFYWLP